MSTDQICFICGFLLTTPIKICKHYVDLLCYLFADFVPTCPDGTCIVPPQSSFAFPCAQLPVDMLKVAQVEKLAAVSEVDYRAFLKRNSEVLLDQQISEATRRLNLRDAAQRLGIPTMRVTFMDNPAQASCCAPHF